MDFVLALQVVLESGEGLVEDSFLDWVSVLHDSIVILGLDVGRVKELLDHSLRADEHLAAIL